MTISELIKALRSLKIQTNSFACLGCGQDAFLLIAGAE